MYTDLAAVLATPGNEAATGLRGDWLTGGLGADLVIGTNGEDVLFGGGGADILAGGAGNDELNGDDNYRFEATLWLADNHWLTADLDTLPLKQAPGSSFTLIKSGRSVFVDDNATRDGGPDALYGGGGDDRLFGITGEDTLDGGVGRDILFGGADNDLLIGGPRGEDKSVPISVDVPISVADARRLTGRGQQENDECK